jgi:hypothetical protein
MNVSSFADRRSDVDHLYTSQLLERDEMVWKQLFKQLVEYKKTHHTILIQTKDKDHSSLQNWKKRQLRLDRRRKLSPERKEALLDVGVAFSLAKEEITPDNRKYTAVQQKTGTTCSKSWLCTKKRMDIAKCHILILPTTTHVWQSGCTVNALSHRKFGCFSNGNTEQRWDLRGVFAQGKITLVGETMRPRMRLAQ